MDGFALEVIAEGEIPQHLEERVVIGGHADVLNVAGAEAFLAGGGPRELELADAQELRLELVHAGRREEHSWIVARDEHVAGLADAALRGEEIQVAFTQFVGLHQPSSLLSRPFLEHALRLRRPNHRESSDLLSTGR